MRGIHVVANSDTPLIRDCSSQEVGREAGFHEGCSVRDVPIPAFATHATGGVEAEGFHERKEGDEGGPDIELEPGGKEVPGRAMLGDQMSHILGS